MTAMAILSSADCEGHARFTKEQAAYVAKQLEGEFETVWLVVPHGNDHFHAIDTGRST